MGGYIGATAVGLTTTAADVQGDITSTDTTPELILKNTSEEDTEGGREGKITFKGEQSGGEESTLAQIESAHDGTSDDQKGDLIFKTNDGNDGAAPTERLRLDSAGDMLLSSPDPSFTITNTTQEDTDGGRESTIVFKGEQSGGELSTLAEIEASHDGTADDEKGDLIFRTNDGSDGASPTERMRIDSNGSILTATLGTDNVHLGEGAGASIASGGNNNVVIGKNAGTAITTGDANVAIGEGSLASNNTADNNTAVGKSALNANTTGTSNTAVGKDALATNQTSNSNTAIGKGAGSSTTVAAGTYVGSLAGENTNSVSNTFVGANAGQNITSGEKNTILGRYNGNENSLDIRTSSNNIVLSDGDGNTRAWCDSSGHFLHSDSNYYPTNKGVVTGTTDTPNKVSARFTSGPNVADGTMQCIIDKYSTTNTTSQWFLGFVINNQATASGVITANGPSQATFTSWSDRRLKENIVDLPPQLDNIMALRPVEFDYIEDEGGGHQISFIAQEIEEIYPDTVGERPDGMKTLSGWSKTEARLVKALQEAVTKIETLENQNTTQATQIADLITRVEALEGA